MILARLCVADVAAWPMRGGFTQEALVDSQGAGYHGVPGKLGLNAPSPFLSEALPQNGIRKEDR